MREGTVGIGGGGVRRKAGSLIDRAKDLARRLDIEILLMDADFIFGRVHVETAVEHAYRAFERRTNAAATSMLEVMLYASGERQLSTAIDKLGVKSDTKRVAVVVSDDKRLDEVFKSLAVERDDTVLEGRAENLPAFGISRKTTASVGKDKAFELVLERVALVDLMK